MGLALWPFIILKHSALKKDAIFIHHETIHLKQQKELLLLPFYLMYMFEWLLRCIWHLDSYKAYQNISFEREAYANEANLNYASERKPFSFIKYL